MARTSKKNLAELNYQLYERASGASWSKWRGIEQKSLEFYLNEQLSAAMKKELKEAGMPNFVINNVTPAIDTIRYFVTANNPRWKAVGVSQDDTDAARVHSEIADYCWYISSGKTIYSQVVLDSLTRSVGYFMVGVDVDADRGRGEVMFWRVDPFDVYPDPQARDILLRDASFIIIKKNLTKTQLINSFPAYKAKIKSASGEASYDNFSQRDYESAEQILAGDLDMSIDPKTAEDDSIIEYIENYTLEKVRFVNAVTLIPLDPDKEAELQERAKYMMEDFAKELKVSLLEKVKQLEEAVASGEMIEARAKLEIERTQKEMGDAMKEKEVEIKQQLRQMMSQTTETVMTYEQFEILVKNPVYKASVVDYSDYYEDRLHVCVSVGKDTFLYKHRYDYSYYTIVPVPYMYTGTPYPMSAVTPLVGKQEEINKAHQIMIHNANLASNLRYMYEEGSIPEKEWEQYSSSPGALLKYRQGFAAPTPIMPLALNNAFYQISVEGKSDIEKMVGIPSSMQGFTQDQPDTYRGILANDEFGTRRVKAWMNTTVEPALEHLGKVHAEVAQKTYTVPKVFRIVQPEAGVGSEVKEVEINQKVWNDYTNEIKVYNDYASSRFDIRMVAGATMPVNRWAKIEEYFRWFQAGAMDDIAFIGETDIENKERLIARNSKMAQASQYIEKLEDELKQQKGDIDTLRRQVIQAGIKSEVEDAERNITRKQADAEVKISRETDRTIAEQKNLQRGIKFELQDAIREIEKETAIAKKSIAKPETK